MRRKSRYGKNAIASDKLPEVESYLESTFRPVSPRPDFVNNLRSRLSTEAMSEWSPIPIGSYVILSVITLFFTVAVVMTAIYAIAGLIGAIRMINLFGRPADEKKILSSQPETP
jgi:hypothetical protein